MMMQELMIILILNWLHCSLEALIMTWIYVWGDHMSSSTVYMDAIMFMWI